MRKRHKEQIENYIYNSDETISIPLTKNKFTVVDIENLETIKQYCWSLTQAGYNNYVVSYTKGEKLYLHRLLMSCDSTKQIDHINMNGLDNRNSNLRICTISQNRCNRPSQYNGTSKFKGVCKSRGYFAVQLQIDNKRVYASTYKSEIEAAKAYDKVAMEYHGEFALTNKKLRLL